MTRRRERSRSGRDDVIVDVITCDVVIEDVCGWLVAVWHDVMGGDVGGAHSGVARVDEVEGRLFLMLATLSCCRCVPVDAIQNAAFLLG